jgi:hypothetical protein
MIGRSESTTASFSIMEARITISFRDIPTSFPRSRHSGGSRCQNRFTIVAAIVALETGFLNW